MSERAAAAQEEQPRFWSWKSAAYALAAVLLLLFSVWPLAVVIASVGAVARYRAHYRPRQQPDDAETENINNGVTVKHLYSLFPRIVALEGWAGLFKGAGVCAFCSVPLLSLTADQCLISSCF